MYFCTQRYDSCDDAWLKIKKKRASQLKQILECIERIRAMKRATRRSLPRNMNANWNGQSTKRVRRSCNNTPKSNPNAKHAETKNWTCKIWVYSHFGGGWWWLVMVMVGGVCLIKIRLRLRLLVVVTTVRWTATACATTIESCVYCFFFCFSFSSHFGCMSSPLSVHCLCFDFVTPLSSSVTLR